MRVKKAKELTQEQAIPTEGFSSWLQHTRQAQRTEEGASVPCGDCKACCTSSYFVHIGPDETETLARIPQELRFAAPGLPKGHVVLGHDKNGHCPMFSENKCSIYEYRPQTCRKYDCRIFPATGLPAGTDKPVIARQAGRWQFAFPTLQDHEHFRAVQAAAKFLREHAESFPAGFVPNNPTQQAAVAIKVYEVFLHPTNASANGEHAAPKHAIVEAVIAAYERFARAENA